MLRKVLYPTDFSDCSRKALDYLKDLKGAGVREVVALHVIDQRELDAIQHHSETRPDLVTDLEKIMRRSTQENMRSLAAELEAAGFEVKERIEQGVPFREILKVEEEEDVSLVVMCSHGKSAIAEMLLGSVSEKVLRKSRRPVFLVRR